MRDSEQTRLRALLRSLTRDLETISPASPVELFARLRIDLAEIVSALDLGPEPATRHCPQCGAACRAAAVACSNCWTRLTPVRESLGF
jgi:hypothetical protein